MDAPILLAAAAALTCLLPAAAEPVTRARYVMGTVLEIEAHGPASAVGEALDEVQRLDALLSTWNPASDVSRINRSAGGAPLPCPPPLAGLVLHSLHWRHATGGAFSPSLHPLITTYGMESSRRTPSPDELSLALAASSTTLIESGDGWIRLRQAGAGLNFGAIGKGWALDRAGAILRFRGITSARLNFGGQILAIGALPGATGWPVVTAGSGETIMLRDASASTSSPRAGGDPDAPGHILEPATGVLIERDAQVTVIAPTATAADALSTACLVLGPDRSARLLPTLPGTRAIWSPIRPRPAD